MPYVMSSNRLRFQLTRLAPNYIVTALAVSGNVPPQRPPRKEVERCRRDRRRAPQSPSPISLTAPARRETNAPSRCINRTSDIRPIQSPHRFRCTFTPSDMRPRKRRKRKKGRRAPFFTFSPQGSRSRCSSFRPRCPFRIWSDRRSTPRSSLRRIRIPAWPGAIPCRCAC